MAQKGNPGQAYMAFTLNITATATNLVALAQSQLGLAVPNTFNQYQIQIDPEDSSGNQVRLGNGNVGATLGGIVQKGVTMQIGDNATVRAETMNGAYFGSLFGQTVSGTQQINVQVWEA